MLEPSFKVGKWLKFNPDPGWLKCQKYTWRGRHHFTNRFNRIKNVFTSLLPYMSWDWHCLCTVLGGVDRWMKIKQTFSSYFNRKTSRAAIGVHIGLDTNQTSKNTSTYTDVHSFLRGFLVLGSIPIHTEYRCIFLLWYELLIYHHACVFHYTTFGMLRCAARHCFRPDPFQCCASKQAWCDCEAWWG